jgi:hypothetical protein
LFVCALSEEKATGEGVDEEDEIDEEEEEEIEQEAQKEVPVQVMTIQQCLESFVNPTIIYHYSLLLKDYKTISATSLHQITTFFEKIATMSEHEPMLYQLSLLNLFGTIAADPSVNQKSEFQRLLSFIKLLVRDFVAALQFNDCLSFYALCWKRKNECHLFDPKKKFTRR